MLYRKLMNCCTYNIHESQKCWKKASHKNILCDSIYIKYKTDKSKNYNVYGYKSGKTSKENHENAKIKNQDSGYF